MLTKVNKFLSMHCIFTDGASIIYIKNIYLKYLLSKTKTQFIWNLTILFLITISNTTLPNNFYQVEKPIVGGFLVSAPN